MNEQGAIKDIRENICTGKGSSIFCRDECMYGKRGCAYQLAMQALEKQIPKKVNKETKDSYGNVIPRCPSCSKMFVEDYCSKCGQKIDWTVEE